MPFVHEDSRGTPIRAGQLVAYNRSGDVIAGTVLDVHPGHIKIRPQPEHTISYGSNVSRVKRGRSILVLAEPEQLSAARRDRT